MRAFNYGAYAGSAIATIPVPFPVPMRATPNLGSSLSGVTLGGVTLGNLGGESIHGARQLISATGANVNANLTFGISDYFEASAEL